MSWECNDETSDFVELLTKLFVYARVFGWDLRGLSHLKEGNEVEACEWSR